MSTFDGIVPEFPAIRIDFFRSSTHHPPPLACFLSHVHSDHLQGLESLKAPFVYCSPATREILLQLERYPHRMNFAKGILESRVQTYRNLKKLLKTIPLETSTAIELSPGNDIQVTLFDANHCVGSVMFLIQGQGKAVLYTGDVRAEVWWVNSLVRNPLLVPFASGHKCLDKIYLDTTFASRSELNRKFPSKAEGLRELLSKLSDYPEDTIFHFEAWTFGYENVWIALSGYLKSQIHLDRYRWGLYKSLITADGLPPCPEAPPLVGFQLGNHRKNGCLTSIPSVRLHSCEWGSLCHVIEGNPNVVRIVPVVTRLGDGTEIAEAGIGGGKGDLDQIHELETNYPATVGRLMQLCASRLEDPATLSKLLQKLAAAKDGEQGRIRLSSRCSPSSRDKMAVEEEKLGQLDQLPLQRFVEMLARLASSDTPATPPAPSAAHQTGKTQHVSSSSRAAAATAVDDNKNDKTTTTDTNPAADQGPRRLLPRTLTFPWARHASYSELCELVKAFRPRDLHPCTVVDEAHWTPDDGMRALFGEFCSDDLFAHDAMMMEAWEQRRRRESSERRGEKRKQRETQETESGDESQEPYPRAIGESLAARWSGGAGAGAGGDDDLLYMPDCALSPDHRARDSDVGAAERRSRSADFQGARVAVMSTRNSTEALVAGTAKSEEEGAVEPADQPISPSIREWAGRAARNSQGMSWTAFGGLICTGNGHTEEEIEL